MSRDEYVPRNPRHRSNEVDVEISRAGGSQAGTIKARLVDLSRNGFQVRLPAALDRQEAITMDLRCETTSLRLTLAGVVQWQRREAGDAWLAGCSSPNQLDLETLGELFLTGVLRMDESASKEPH